MQVAQEISQDTHVQHTSNVCMYYVMCCIACEQQHMCILSSCPSPPLNPAHTQYTKYKHQSHSNYGQRTHLIQTQYQSIGSQHHWHLLLVVSVYVLDGSTTCNI